MIKHGIDCLISYDNCSAIQAQTSACADPEKYGILHLRMGHQLDGLVQEDAYWRNAHAVLQQKHDLKTVPIADSRKNCVKDK